MAEVDFAVVFAAKDDPDRLNDIIRQLEELIKSEDANERRRYEYKSWLSSAQNWLQDCTKDLKPAAVDLSTPAAVDFSTLTEAEFQRVKTDPTELKAFIKRLDYATKRDPPIHSREHLIRLGAATNAYETLISHDEPEDYARRVASITFGLGEVFRHLIDFVAFLKLVKGLFKWFESEHTTYMAPFFPVIQSSGSGKTRLLVGLRDKCKDPKTDVNFDCVVPETGVDLDCEDPETDVDLDCEVPKTNVVLDCEDPETDTDFDCKLILCLDHDTHYDPDESSYFDEVIQLRKIPNTAKAQAQENLRIVRILEKLLSKCNKRKVVFLFDEAQNLLGTEGFAFKCVRWWLRRSRTVEPLAKAEGEAGPKEVGGDDETEDEFNEEDPADEASTKEEEEGDNEEFSNDRKLNVAKQVVAVFAGTTSSLANFYRDFPSSGFSRAPEADYVNWTKEKEGPTKLYDPFFRICTIGCYRNDVPSDGMMSEFERAAFFGRPLFAYLQKRKMLTTDETINDAVICNTTLHAILTRMLLNKIGNWQSNRTSLCSILGSRVQMGITTSFVVSSELVSKAYAHLVQFNPDKTGDLTKAVARIAFMPDPVCAALAMGMMDDRWALKDSDDLHQISGESKPFWSRTAMELLSSGLCLPEKGNPGEIMVALYMLFCGDVMRYRQKATLREFSIPLEEWFLMLKDPIIRFTTSQRGKKRPRSESATAAKSSSPKMSRELRSLTSTKVKPLSRRGPTSTEVEPPSPISMEVNFIQVCRNYFRAHSWRTQKGLEWMYKSATATYVYSNCPGVDLVAAIRVLKSGVFYHPLLVSVKCYAQFTAADITKAIEKMKALVVKIRNKKPQGCPAALCLLVFIGSETTATFSNSLGRNDLNGFPEADTFRCISVPDKDPFAISNAVRQMTSAFAMTEIYSSHCYVYGEDEGNPANALRANPQKEEVKFATELFSKLSATTPSASI